MRPLLLALLVFFCFPASADIAGGKPLFDWTNPLNWTNGDPITAAQITGYTFSCTGAATITERVTAMPATLPPTFAPGAYSCTAVVHGKKTPTTAETTSLPSAPVSFTVPQPRMNPMTGLSAN